ncbi:MAG TPA: CbtA family protein [Candidatus Binatia bacterium]
MPLGKLLKAAVLAGLLAGAAAAGFHWFFTEPLIDRAVEIEAHAHASPGGSPEEPVVSRPVQKLGLFAGFLLYGAAWGLLFGLLVHAVGGRYAGLSRGRLGFVLALLLGWSAALFPMLKYPANPPGVGEGATIGYRQELFLGFLALSLAGATIALAAERRMRRSGRARAAVVLAYGAYLAAVFFLLPDNPDPVRLAPEFIREFRLLSLAGQLLFWALMGGAFWRLAGSGPQSS